jgi:hypothetical protein
MMSTYVRIILQLSFMLALGIQITACNPSGNTSTEIPDTPGSTTPVNHPPVISGTPSTTIAQDETYTFTPTASDPDNDSLTFSASNVPGWLSFDSLTGQISGTPVNSDVGSYSDIQINVSDGIATASLEPFSISVCADCSVLPMVLYTDITSGPNLGGENNNGAYLSIFGVNFGPDSALGTTTKVYIGGEEVATYKYMGLAVAQPFGPNLPLQQISVQIGAIGNPTPGTALPVTVDVNGAVSNTDHTFRVQPGDILYVSNSGSQTNGDGSFQNPYAKVQNTNTSDPAYGKAGPGDFIVMRGGTYADTGMYNGSNYYFCRFNKSGTAANGSEENGPITIMGYPGETVTIELGTDNNGGFVAGPSAHPEWGNFITLANLHINGGTRETGDGPLNGQYHGEGWRVVNVEVFDWLAGTQARAGAFSGTSINSKFFGNAFHNIQGGTLNHGMYFDSYSDNVEVAYNHIYDMSGGNIIQLYNSNGADLRNFSIHHNLLHDGSRYGLNFSGGTVSVQAYNNIIYNTALSGVRFATTAGTNIDVYYNTLYNVATNPPSSSYRAINNDGWGDGITVRNNIVHTINATQYYGNDTTNTNLVLDNNLYWGISAAAPAEDAHAIVADPMFVDAESNRDFHLLLGSPAVDQAAPGMTNNNDFYFDPRPNGDGPDIGAVEY